MAWGFPYALLLAFGAIPLIVFLHSLRPRAVRFKTTTYFIWERVLRARPLGTRLGWLLRKNLLLLLQIIAALLLIAVLADPSALYVAGVSGDLIVVLDQSASMKARGKSGLRFEAARNEFFTLVDSLSSRQRMMVIGAGPQPRVLAPFTTDKRRLRELGRGFTATDAPGRVREAVLFAHAFLKKGSPDRVVVISDGAFDGASDFSWGSPHLRLIQIEGTNDNVGIVGFEVRRQRNRVSQVEIMTHIKNFSAKTMRAPVVLSLAGKRLWRESVEIEPGGRRVLVFPHDGELQGVLEARLDIEDDFATDNRASLILSPSAPVHVLYVGPGNPFLSKLVQFFPNVRWTSAERWDPESPVHATADVVIFDRVAPPPLSSGRFILINTTAPNLPLTVRGKVERPRISAPLLRHPLTAGLQLGDLYVKEALRLRSKEGVVLAHSHEDPLLWAWEKDGLRVLVLGFDLLESDLPVRVAFPLLFYNALDWFQPSRFEFPATAVRAGDPIQLSTNAEKVQVTTPSGREHVLNTESGSVSFTETIEAGIYAFRTGVQAGRFAVNLLDESESQISPRISAGGKRSYERATTSANSEVAVSFWPYLVILAIAVLSAEAALAVRVAPSYRSMVVRAAALGALITAVVNPRFFHSAKLLDVIIATDFSRSVGRQGAEKASQVLEVANRVKHPDTRTGLLFFGREPSWEFLPRASFPVPDLSPRIDREETDILAALQAALAQFGEGREKRLLLISDGNENHGDSIGLVPLLRANDVQVSTLPVSLAAGRNEIYLSDFIAPKRVDSAESFEVRGAIESFRDAGARVKLLRDGAVQREQEIQLKAGTNWVSFRDSLRERGMHQIDLLVESNDDTLPENNMLQAIVEVSGPPRVLYLAAQGRRALSRALQTQGYAVVESSAELHPLALPQLSSFDLLVLDNVPAYLLSQAKMDAVEKYVRDLGGGLLVIGGDQSYGAGGYYRTPLERLLPLDMRPPARLDFPHVALLFVIDKSGSMGGGAEGSSKLDLAKAAAIAAADVLNRTDQVGLLGFDASWNWVLPFRPIGNGEWIAERLADLQSDGGTDLYKALVEAHRAIAARQAAIKHVLILSDGLTDKMDFHSLVTQMVRDGITVSTVAVGNDADFKLMAEIAKDGKGRSYVALDPQTIPQIFTSETLLVSRDLLIEKPTTASMIAPVGPLKGFSRASLPQLRGYVLTYPKSRAELLMKADDDPLLASWRYGLGRVVAFTSDLSGRWGREWLTWEGFPLWASQLARFTMRQMHDSQVRAKIEQDGTDVKVIADLLSRDGEFINFLSLKGKFTRSEKESEERPFIQVAPGRYEGRFASGPSGTHFLTIYADAAGNGTASVLATVPYVTPYPKEYRDLKPNFGFLSRLAEKTGGKLLDPGKMEESVKRLYTPDPRKATRGQESWWFFAGIGLFCFLTDLVLRSWPRTSWIAARLATPASG